MKIRTGPDGQVNIEEISFNDLHASYRQWEVRYPGGPVDIMGLINQFDNQISNWLIKLFRSICFSKDFMEVQISIQ